MNQPKQTSPSISSPLSTVSSEDEDAGYLEAAEDYSREVSYEPSDNATPAATSANTDNDHQEAGPSTAKDKKKRASGTKRGKINRPTMSCDQCQRKKTRCNRVSPCESCIARGETCTWQVAKPLQIISNREVNVEADISSAVITLQSLVSQIQGIVDSANALSALHNIIPSADAISTSASVTPTSPSAAQLASEMQRSSQAIPANSSSSSSNHAASSSRSSSDQIDVQGDDICEALAQLAVGHVQIHRTRTGMVKICPLVEEARLLSESLPQVFGLEFNMPAFNPFSSNPVASSRSSIAALLLRLPPDDLATVSSDFYHRFMDSFFHPLHVPTFERNAVNLRKQVQEARWQEVDLFFAATYLAVCALGTATMSEERAVKKGFPVGRKTILSKEWLALSLHALHLGHFFDNPAFEALRALFLISAYFICQADGNSAAPALKTLSLTIQLAYDIGLDNDPDELDETFTLVEAEERRRFIHTMLAFQVTFTGHLGRQSGHAITKQVVTCRLPRDCEDVDLEKGVDASKSPERETVMSSILARIHLAGISRDLNDLLLRSGSVSVPAMQEIDKRLQKFKDNLPAWYQIRFNNNEIDFPATLGPATQIRAVLLHMCLWTEVLRLHRPFLLRGLMDPAKAGTSRQSCVEAARVLLAIHRLPAMRQMWSGLQWQGYSAAVALGIDILCHPDDLQTDLHLGEIRKARDLMADHSDCSLMMQKGVKIIDLLLSKIDIYRSNRTRQSSKRGRLGGYYETLFSSSTVVPAQGQSNGEELHHKERTLSIRDKDVDLPAVNYQPILQPNHPVYEAQDIVQPADSSEPVPARHSSSNSHSPIQAVTSRFPTAGISEHPPASFIPPNANFNFQAPEIAPHFPQTMPDWPGAIPTFQPDSMQYRHPPALSAPLPLLYHSPQADYFQPHRMPPHQYHHTYPQSQHSFQVRPSFQPQGYSGGPLPTNSIARTQGSHPSTGPYANSADPWRDVGVGYSGATLLDAVDWSKDFST